MKGFLSAFSVAFAVLLLFLLVLAISPTRAQPTGDEANLSFVADLTKREASRLLGAEGGAIGRARPQQPSGTPGIYGRVTVDGTPAVDIELDLRAHLGSETTVITTTTDVDGHYVFADPPSLPFGAAYYVRYVNATGDPNHVWVWFGPNVETYTAGDSVFGGEFDIADIVLESPPAGATRTPPVTFKWAPRDVARDSYRWYMVNDLADTVWRSSPLGDVGQYVLNSLPRGVVAGQQFWWFVAAFQSSDSFGVSRLRHSIAYAEATGTPPAQTTPTVTPTATNTAPHWRRVYVPVVMR